ncbi:transcriptional regulator, XRE family [Methylobacterium sp. 4-46]|uniref:helix-turn-helix domain-containing protein n=1 Tax=unclassified Methylobacterium TaxID=2615210 RepID=UPI000152DB49|nr:MULTISPECIES: helix-turn-helix transcriptional regulator [Methylobacterium]ACA18429.1 transcriptional regulator, XRE family [Methylobacterium sp. 4-46]WFT77722.1 helix-turn-helix transcriptional regulator [Methylobacterium nodulans]
MTVQIITTPGGEELVILPRRDYDALLARLGDEAAEDRAAARLLDARADEKASVEHWFVALIAEHGSPVTAARKHHGCTQAQLAEALGISQGHLSDIERGRRQLTPTQRHQIAAETGVIADWLE